MNIFLLKTFQPQSIADFEGNRNRKKRESKHGLLAECQKWYKDYFLPTEILRQKMIKFDVTSHLVLLVYPSSRSYPVLWHGHYLCKKSKQSLFPEEMSNDVSQELKYASVISQKKCMQFDYKIWCTNIWNYLQDCTGHI